MPTSPRVYLRAPLAADERAFIALACASEPLHQPWTQAPATPEQFAAFLARTTQPHQHSWLVCVQAASHSSTTAAEQIAGVISLTNIVMGAFCSGYLGYYCFAPFARKGIMRKGLLLVIDEAFNRLGLHRLEANIQPNNSASIALVKSCHFTKEGYSPRYLKINDEWCDHERWAIVNDH